ncbi:interferon-induced transmembrane protein 1-like [Pelodiscus sinensis]|uniref:Interferon-induced transmembrane protein 1-like n=1 Tax=Pelodiscus sinensis TaxID=13735 RepID=K7FR89_PELSI|nr:interferon-induced transmembrane protein 1-like [Pelodiscus sinensis]|eukprot:XP_006131716.1 interferon-induced transmembrane protein 1-like [Pelodiscus sinensis]
MDNAQFPFPALSQPFPQHNYQHLKEEHEIGVVSPGAAVTSTVISMQPYQPPPRDHVLWSVFTTLYLNFCCLGFMALVFSVKARDRKVVGDVSGASSYGSTAKCLNILALVLTLLTVILIIILLAAGVIAVSHGIHGV